MSALSINHPWLIAAGVAAGILYAALYYFKDPKFAQVSKFWVWLMAGLRFLAVFLIFILLAGIYAKTTTYFREKPVIAILQDNSKSIRYALDSSYLENFREKLDKEIAILKNDYNVKLYTFDKDLNNTAEPTYNGNYTNISGAITSLNNSFPQRNLGAIVLISDGIYNMGQNPVQDPQVMQTPVFTVLLGDTTKRKDIKIYSIKNNPVSYQGNLFPVSITVEAKELAGQQATVKVKFEDSIKTQTFTISSNNYKKTFLFYFKAKSPGKKLINASVSHLPGEKNLKNNTQTGSIQIINIKQKILILSTFPHPDIAALVRSLNNSLTLEAKYYPADKFKGNISSYNLVVLYQMPDGTQISQNILSQIRKHNIPALFICGSKCDYQRFANLNTGFEIKPVSGEYNEAFPVYNQNFDAFVIDKDIQNLLPKLPPLIAPFGEFKTTGTNRALLTQKIKNIATDQPLIAFIDQSPFNNTKTGVIAGEGIWRWRMTDYKLNGNTNAFDRLFRQILQYLANKKNKKRFIVNALDVINQNDDIIITAQLFDKSYSATTLPQVDLKITDSAGNNFNYTFDRKENYYIINIGSLPKGIYSYSATTQLAGEHFEEKGSFVVRQVDYEAFSLRADSLLLKQLAIKTNARFTYADKINTLPSAVNSLDLMSKRLSKTRTTELIDNLWLVILIILLLSAEWGLRKYFGNI